MNLIATSLNCILSFYSLTKPHHSNNEESAVPLEIGTGRGKLRTATLVWAVGAIITMISYPALATDEAPSSGHGGSGIISGSNCFKTNSQTVTEVCADYKISWKLWVLMGEPVGDYRLQWTLQNFTISRGGWINSSVRVDAQAIPPALANEARSIELYLDAVAAVDVGTKNSSRFGLTPLASHGFNTGVASRAGKLSYNTPGSPKWSELFMPVGASSFSFSQYLSESEAKDIFKRSNQPEAPIILWDLKIGPKSTVTGVDGLENKIAKLCSNPKTAKNYDFCPEVKEKPQEEKDKSKDKEEAKRNPIEDGFADLEKPKPATPPKSGSTANGNATRPANGPKAKEPTHVETKMSVAHAEHGNIAGTIWLFEESEYQNGHYYLFQKDGKLSRKVDAELYNQEDSYWLQDGSAITFQLPSNPKGFNFKFRGIISGDQMKGTGVDIFGRDFSWTAKKQ